MSDVISTNDLSQHQPFILVASRTMKACFLRGEVLKFKRLNWLNISMLLAWNINTKNPCMWSLCKSRDSQAMLFPKQASKQGLLSRQTAQNRENVPNIGYLTEWTCRSSCWIAGFRRSNKPSAMASWPGEFSTTATEAILLLATELAVTRG